MSYEVPAVNNHEALALSRLLQQFSRESDVAGMVRLLASRTQTLEGVFNAILTADSLELAEGAQLDVLGGIVGQARGALSDEDYRTRISARILVNRSSGTAPELQEVANLVAPDATARYVYQGPAGFSLLLDDAEVDAGYELAGLLLEAAMGGVHVFIQWTEVTPATTLTLNSSTAGQRLNEGFLAFARSA